MQKIKLNLPNYLRRLFENANKNFVDFQKLKYCASKTLSDNLRWRELANYGC
jgi:hypothetical protein